jgi:hypothetical protein
MVRRLELAHIKPTTQSNTLDCVPICEHHNVLKGPTTHVNLEEKERKKRRERTIKHKHQQKAAANPRDRRGCTTESEGEGLPSFLSLSPSLSLSLWCVQAGLMSCPQSAGIAGVQSSVHLPSQETERERERDRER